MLVVVLTECYTDNALPCAVDLLRGHLRVRLAAGAHDPDGGHGMLWLESLNAAADLARAGDLRVVRRLEPLLQLGGELVVAGLLRCGNIPDLQPFLVCA